MTTEAEKTDAEKLIEEVTENPDIKVITLSLDDLLAEHGPDGVGKAIQEQLEDMLFEAQANDIASMVSAVMRKHGEDTRELELKINALLREHLKTFHCKAHREPSAIGVMLSQLGALLLSGTVDNPIPSAGLVQVRLEGIFRALTAVVKHTHGELVKYAKGDENEFGKLGLDPYPEGDPAHGLLRATVKGGVN